MCTSSACDCYCYKHLPLHEPLGEWMVCPNCAASVRLVETQMQTAYGDLVPATRHEYAGMDGALW